MDLENPGHLAGLRALVFGGSAVIGYLVGHSRQSRAISHTEELPAKVLSVADPCDAYRFNDYLRPQGCETIADRLDLRPAFYAQESDESLCYRDGPGDFSSKTDASLTTTSPPDTHTLAAPGISPNLYVEEHQYRVPSFATKLRQVLVVGFLMVALTILALSPPLLRLEVVLSIFLLIVFSWYLYQLILYLYKEMRAKLWRPKTVKDQPTGREVLHEGELKKVEGQLEGAVEKVAGRLVGEVKKHVQNLRLDYEEKFEAQTKAMAELEVAVENASFRNFEDQQVSTICNRTARELKDVQADLQLVGTKAVLLESKIDVNSTSVVQLGTVVNANSTNMSQLRTDVDANKINVRQLQNGVKTIAADMNDPEGKVGRISTKASKLRTDFKTSSEDMTNFKKSVEGMEGRLLIKVGGELDKKVRTRSREEVTAQVRVVKERQTRLDDALGRHLRLIDGVETSTSKLQEDVRDIKERQEELDQQFKQVGSVGTTASDLQISLKAVEGGQAEIKKALGGQLERTERVSTVADELQKGFKDLKNGVDAQLADQLEQVDGKVEAIVSPLQENLKAVEDRQAKLEVLGNQLKHVDEKVDASVSPLRDDLKALGIHVDVQHGDQLKQVDKKVDASVSPIRDNLTTLEIRVGEQLNRVAGVETSLSHLQEKFEVFGERLDTQLGDQLSQKVADQVREQVNLQVKAFGDQLRLDFAEQARSQVHEQVEQQVRKRVTDLEQVNKQLHGEIEKQVQERVETETKAIEGRLRVELRKACSRAKHKSGRQTVQ
jgi:chromosome segregation ATPase